MTRRRLAVALLFDAATTTAIDDLRRSFGVEDLERIAPHVTVVPPVDLPADSVAGVLHQIDLACRSAPPLALELGPGATFAPRTPTIHLAVSGDVGALADLRGRVRQPPLPQREQWTFVPHVTVVERAGDDAIESGLARLAAVHLSVRVGAVSVLEHLPRPGGGRRWWQPIATATLAGS